MIAAEPPEGDGLSRLDPDRAAAAPQRHPRPAARRPEAPFDPRRYTRMLGFGAIVLLVGFSIYHYGTHGVGGVGIPAGKPLRFFSVPLASSNLVGDANLSPPCTAGQHDPRAINLCLLSRRGPVVLAFFVTGSSSCVRGIDTVQALARRMAGRPVQYVAVAVRSGPADARAVVRKHHWTIPVGYDRDGAVGARYGVATCPLLELARRGGTVAARLIGNHWLSAAALAIQVRRLGAG